MPVFFISSNAKKVTFASNRFQNLYEKIFPIEQLTRDVQITLSDNKVLKKDLRGGKLFGFGVFFNGYGFFEDALKNVNCLDDFKEIQQNDLHGHYIFIIVHDDYIYVTTDKVGMINVFFVENNEGFAVSTDLQMLAITSPNSRLSPQGVKEFIFKESTVGCETIFKDIKRLNFGNEILISRKSLMEKKVHVYKFEDLSFEEYSKRIEHYFKILNKFNGHITTDISAGFDTRLVASIACKTVSNIEANTNPNKFDGGVDNTLSPIVAQNLNLRLTKIQNEKECNNKIKMLHCVIVGRDIIRSRFWPSRLEQKFKRFSLSLGGYGGETIRAKYNNLKATEYYASPEVARVLNDKDYNTLLKNKLQHYAAFTTNNQQTNFIYTVDRMRIWGGTQVYLNFLHGATLHPFMDWQLVGPIFSMNPKKLEGGKLQEKLILQFSPQLKDVPINRLNYSGFDIDSLKTTIKKQVIKSRFLKSLAKTVTPNHKNKKNEVDLLYNNYPKSNLFIDDFAEIGVCVNDIEKNARADVLSRLFTVNEALQYVKSEADRNFY